MPDLTDDKILELIGIFEKAHAEGRVRSPRLHDNIGQVAAAFEQPEEGEKRAVVRKQIQRAIRLSRSAQFAGFDARSTMMIAGPDVDSFLKNAEAQERGEVRVPSTTGRFAGGPVGETLGSLATGVLEAVEPAIPFVSLPEGLRDATQRASEDLGTTADIARTVGHSIPVILGGSALAQRLGSGSVARALGTRALAGSVRSSLAAGALVGAATTPGDIDDRFAGALFGATGFGTGAVLGKTFKPIATNFGLKILANGASRSWAREQAARFVPGLTTFAADTLGFSLLGAGQEALQGREVEWWQQFMSNAAVMLAARGLAGRTGRKDRKLAERVLKETRGTGELTRLRFDLLNALPDPVMVEIAYRRALRGRKITTRELQTLERGGPEALRRELVDMMIVTPKQERLSGGELRAGESLASSIRGGRRIQELFAKDLDRTRTRGEPRQLQFDLREPPRRLIHRVPLSVFPGAKKAFRSPEITKDTDGFLYHVTTKDAAAIIEKQGIVPHPGAFRAYELERGFPSPNSVGRAFFTEKGGVPYWVDNVIGSAAKDIGVRDIAVFRVRKSDLPKFHPDPHDVTGGDVFVTKTVPPFRDIMAKVLPTESKAASELEGTTVERNIRIIEDLADFNVALKPGQKITLDDVATPDGMARLVERLVSRPPRLPGSIRARLYGQYAPWRFGELGLFSRGRQIETTFRRGLPQEQANILLEGFRTATYTETTRVDLNRRNVAEATLQYAEWLGKLPRNRQVEAQDRLFAATEKTAEVPLNQIEARMVNTLRSIFGNDGYLGILKKMHKAGLLKDIDPFKFDSEAYLPHIFSFVMKNEGAPPEVVRRFSTPSALSRFLKRRTGGQGYVREVFPVLDAYINSVERMIAWTPVEKLVKDTFRNLERQGIPKGSEKTFERTKEFINNQVALGMGKITPSRFLSPVARALSFLVPGLRNLRAQRNPGRTMLDGYVWLQYLGALGASPGSALKNLTQNVNTFAEIGPQWWAKGVGNFWAVERAPQAILPRARFVTEADPTKPLFEGGGFRIKINPLVHELGLLDPALMADIASHVNRTAGGKLVKSMGAASDVLMTMFRNAEWFNRSVAGLGAYYKALNRTGSHLRAKRASRDVTARTQFDYSRALGGQIYQGPIAKAVFQFARFPVYQMDYLGTLVRRAVNNDTFGMAPGDKAILPAILFATGMGALNWGMRAIGINMDEVEAPAAQLPEIAKFPVRAAAEFAGAELAEARSESLIAGREKGRQFARALGFGTFAQSPWRAAMGSLGPAVTQVGTVLDYLSLQPDEQRQARLRLGRDFKLIIPAGLAIHRIRRFFREHEDGQVRSEATGEPLVPLGDGDDILRLLGINGLETAEGFRELSDRRLRASAERSVMAALNNETLQRWRKDKDQSKAFAFWAKGLIEVQRDKGIAFSNDQIQQRWQALRARFFKTEGKTQLERLREQQLGVK